MKTLRLLVFVLISLLIFSPARSQWAPCKGIEGGTTESITYQDSSLFIVGYAGIFKRQVDDPSWDSACLVYNVVKVRSTGNALFTYGGEIMSNFFRSLDNGITWEDMSWLSYDYRDMETIDSVIFIDTGDRVLLRSTDNGETWTEIHPSLIQASAAGIYAQPGIFFCFLEDIDTLFRSDDYGMSWIKYPMTGVNGVGCPYLYNGNLWLAQGNNFFTFDDEDQEWIMQYDSLSSGVTVSNFIEDGGSLGCITNDGYYLFNQQNFTWQDHSQGLEDRRIRDACKVGGAIYIATESGPFSKSGNEDWAPQYNNLFGAEVSKVFAFGGRTYALAKGKIFTSGDIEDGFEPVGTQGYCPAYDMVVTEAGWYEGSQCGFSISVDSGQTWTDFSSGLEGLSVYQIAKTNVYYFAATIRNHGLFRSHTYYNSWERVPNELGTMYIDDLETIDNVLFALCENNILYSSVDFGTTFDSVNVGDDYSYMMVKNNTIFFVRDYDIIYSTDSGNSWQTWIDGIYSPYVYCLDFTNSLDATVVGGFLGPWDPLNFMELYNAENPYGEDIIDDLPPYLWSQIQYVMIDNDRLFACPSSGGLWYRDDLMVDIKEDNPGKDPSSKSLQLFPNPASKILTIEMKENAGQGEYLIFDQSGRMMIRGPKEKNKSRINIDVSGFPQGIYCVVYRYDNGFSVTGKFVKTD